VVRQWPAVDDLEAIRRALSGRLAPDEPAGGSGDAAVAMLLRGAPGGAELLFIHRAEHPHDPWSGHMAFPGGRLERGDASPLEAAVRETREEIGVDLSNRAELLGRLSPVRTHRALPRFVFPFVFEVEGALEVTLNGEVQEVLWVPLAFLADRGNRDTFVWKGRGVPLPLPRYLYRERMIWGLSLSMVDELLRLVVPA
jgi:8-oxo-dGTP pyrophosphatase MutT (NUDIX family)